MKLELQNRSGIEPRSMKLNPATYSHVRLTIPAREALETAEATIAREPDDATSGATLYSVTLHPRKPVPDGLIAVRLLNTDHLGLRLAIEPQYPGEIATYWEQVDFAGCPKCRKPLIWWEAGYVPGYRVCAGKSHHHVMAR